MFDKGKTSKEITGNCFVYPSYNVFQASVRRRCGRNKGAEEGVQKQGACCKDVLHN